MAAPSPPTAAPVRLLGRLRRGLSGPRRPPLALPRPPLPFPAGRRPLTQKMRFRNTSTVLEEVMPHWPMVPAVARALLGEPGAPTQRDRNGDDASGLGAARPARRSPQPPASQRLSGPSKHLAQRAAAAVPKAATLLPSN